MQDLKTTAVHPRQYALILRELLNSDIPFAQSAVQIRRLMLVSLPKQEHHRKRREILLRNLFRLCARSSDGLSGVSKAILIESLLGTVIEDRRWNNALICIWDPKAPKPLRGAYQLSLRFAEETLKRIELSLLVRGIAFRFAENLSTYLVATRNALKHAEYGFFHAGPKAHGVRGTKRFGRRLLRAVQRLAALSLHAEDRATAFDLKIRIHHALTPNVKPTHAQRMSAPVATRLFN